MLKSRDHTCDFCHHKCGALNPPEVEQEWGCKDSWAWTPCSPGRQCDGCGNALRRCPQCSPWESDWTSTSTWVDPISCRAIPATSSSCSAANNEGWGWQLSNPKSLRHTWHCPMCRKVFCYACLCRDDQRRKRENPAHRWCCDRTELSEADGHSNCVPGPARRDRAGPRERWCFACETNAGRNYLANQCAVCGDSLCAASLQKATKLQCRLVLPSGEDAAAPTGTVIRYKCTRCLQEESKGNKGQHARTTAADAETKTSEIALAAATPPLLPDHEGPDSLVHEDEQRAPQDRRSTDEGQVEDETGGDSDLSDDDEESMELDQDHSEHASSLGSRRSIKRSASSASIHHDAVADSHLVKRPKTLNEANPFLRVPVLAAELHDADDGDEGSNASNEVLENHKKENAHDGGACGARSLFQAHEECAREDVNVEKLQMEDQDGEELLADGNDDWPTTLASHDDTQTTNTSASRMASHFPPGSHVAVHPGKIAYCQDSISNSCSCGTPLLRTVVQLLEYMIEHRASLLEAADHLQVPTIRVYQTSGCWLQSHDNRRLLAYKYVAWFMHECGELPEKCSVRIEITDEKISDEKRTGDPREWDYSIRVRDVISSRSASKVRGHVVPFDAAYCDLMDRLERLASRAAKAKAQKDESGNDNDNDSSREGGHDVEDKLSCRLMESQATMALLRHTIDEADHVLSAPIIFPRSLILPKPRPIEKRSGPTTITGGGGGGGGRNYPDLVTLVGRGEEQKEEEKADADTKTTGADHSF